MCSSIDRHIKEKIDNFINARIWRYLMRNVDASFCITECSKGWFGMNCTKQCVGQCRDGVTCNHVTGLCDRGCAAGWKGDWCNKGTSCNKSFCVNILRTWYNKFKCLDITVWMLFYISLSFS